MALGDFLANLKLNYKVGWTQVALGALQARSDMGTYMKLFAIIKAEMKWEISSHYCFIHREVSGERVSSNYLRWVAFIRSYFNGKWEDMVLKSFATGPVDYAYDTAFITSKVSTKIAKVKILLQVKISTNTRSGWRSFIPTPKYRPFQFAE